LSNSLFGSMSFFEISVKSQIVGSTKASSGKMPKSRDNR
jgi:hypothetical protein